NAVLLGRMLAGNAVLLGGVLARDAPVLLGQEGHGEVHAGEAASGHVEIAGAAGTGAENDGVERATELVAAGRYADVGAGDEGDALGAQLIEAAVENALGELEVGDAIAKQAAGLRVALEDRDVVAPARELLGGGEAGGARADDGDAASGAGRQAVRAE